MQKDRIRISNPEAARVLRSTAVLQYFLEPSSPSEVAKQTGLAANLVHHHAKKAFDLGILLETKRENGKVYYQLAAKEFSHSRDLLPIEHKEAEDLRLLTGAFLKAYEHSDALLNSNDPDYSRIGFGNGDPDSAPKLQRKSEFLEKHPSHFHARSIHLGQERYAKLMWDISKLIEEAKNESTNETDCCSVAVLGFNGTWLERRDNTTLISTFIPRKS